MFLSRGSLSWISVLLTLLHGVHAMRGSEDVVEAMESEGDAGLGVCPGEQTLNTNSIADLFRAQTAYEGYFGTYSFIGHAGSWFAGGPPQIDRGWAAKVMKPQLVMKHKKTETAKVWSNPGGRWHGSFWATPNIADFFNSSFGTAPDVSPARLVVAKSVPVLGVDRNTGGALSVRVGPGLGTVATSFRQGRCHGLSSDDAVVWDQLKRAPANVFLTTYSTGGTSSFASTRKQVRHGSLAFKLNSKTTLLSEAAVRLRDLVGYALASPFPSPVPRVRFTQLMANYAWIAGKFAEPEGDYINDQIKVIDLFREDLDKTELRYGATATSAGMQLHSRDVVELYYTANVFGTPGPKPFHENFGYSRKQNLPGLLTYLRWIAEDVKQLTEARALELTDAKAASFLELAKKRDFCPGSSKRTGKFKSSIVKKGWMSEWLSEMVDNIEEQRVKGKGGRSSNLKCWNRHLRLLLQHIEEVATSAEKVDIRRLEDALDLLYQLVAQRKEDTEDINSCGQSKVPPGIFSPEDGCSLAHRTSELFQLAVLDSLLGIAVTFSNCKSGLDRTGIYHALQSAVDQLLALYPDCGTSMAYLAIHFTTITDTSARIKEVGRGAPPQCREVAGSVLPLGSMLGRSSWRRLYNLLRNAVLKNLLEVGVKVTYSSTGMPGLKYGGNPAAEALKEAEKQASQGKSFTPPDPDSKANPMVAPFLPPRVAYLIGPTSPGSPPPKEVEMVLTQKYNKELYIANRLTLGGLTAVSLLEDVSKYRGS